MSAALLPQTFRSALASWVLHTGKTGTEDGTEKETAMRSLFLKG